MNTNTNEENAIEEHFDIILYQVAKLYNNKATYDIEDLIQIGFVGVIKAIRNYDSAKGDIKTYVFSCVKNHLIRFLRKERFWQSKVKLGFSDFYDDRQKGDVTSTVKKILEGTRNLLPLERKIMSLKCEGYTRKEICGILDLFNKEYYSLFFSAIGKLRKNES